MTNLTFINGHLWGQVRPRANRSDWPFQCFWFQGLTYSWRTHWGYWEPDLSPSPPPVFDSVDSWVYLHNADVCSVTVADFSLALQSSSVWWKSRQKVQPGLLPDDQNLNINKVQLFITEQWGDNSRVGSCYSYCSGVVLYIFLRTVFMIVTYAGDMSSVRY